MHARAALCTLSLLRASAARSQPRNQSGRRAMHNSASIRDLKWHTQSPRRPHPHAQARALSRRGELSSVHVCVRARGHMDTRVRIREEGWKGHTQTTLTFSNHPNQTRFCCDCSGAPCRWDGQQDRPKNNEQRSQTAPQGRPHCPTLCAITRCVMSRQNTLCHEQTELR